MLIKRKLNELVVDQTKPQPETQRIEPQVKANTRRSRRIFTKADKTRILAAVEACENGSSRGELLRREGLYYSTVSRWRLEQTSVTSVRQKKSSKSQNRVDNLSRENEQLKKKLAQAEAIIDLQKKVSELFGNHILPQTNSEMN